VGSCYKGANPMSEDIPNALLDTRVGRQVVAEVEQARAAAEAARQARIDDWRGKLRSHEKDYIDIRLKVVEHARVMYDLMEDLFSARCRLGEDYSELVKLGVDAKLPRKVMFRTDEVYDEVKRIVDRLSGRLLCA